MSLQTLAKSPATTRFVENSFNVSFQDEASKYLEEIDTMLGDGNITILTGKDGKEILRNSGELEDVSGSEFFQEAMNGNVYVSNVITSETTGIRQITVAAPVINSKGETIGVAQRELELNKFHTFLAEKSSDAFFVDRNGLVAAHSQYEITSANEDDTTRQGISFFEKALENGEITKKTQVDNNYVIKEKTKRTTTNKTESKKVETNKKGKTNKTETTTTKPKKTKPTRAISLSKMKENVSAAKKGEYYISKKGKNGKYTFEKVVGKVFEYDGGKFGYKKTNGEYTIIELSTGIAVNSKTLLKSIFSKVLFLKK